MAGQPGPSRRARERNKSVVRLLFRFRNQHAWETELVNGSAERRKLISIQRTQRSAHSIIFKKLHTTRQTVSFRCIYYNFQNFSYLQRRQTFLSKEMMYSCAIWDEEENDVRGDLTVGPIPGDLEAAQ